MGATRPYGGGGAVADLLLEQGWWRQSGTARHPARTALAAQAGKVQPAHGGACWPSRPSHEPVQSIVAFQTTSPKPSAHLRKFRKLKIFDMSGRRRGRRD